MTIDRPTVRCHQCRLSQYPTIDGQCRRCHGPIVKPIEAEAKIDSPVHYLSGAVPFRRVSKPPMFIDDPIYWIPFIVWHTRIGKGLSQRQVADRCGSPRTWLTKIENGFGGKQRDKIMCLTPMTRSMFRLSDALETSMSRLMAMCEVLAGKGEERQA